MLALLPVAAGCTAARPLPAKDWENPACSGSNNERFPGKLVSNNPLLFVDRFGRPYPDTSTRPLNGERLSRCGYSLEAYFKDDPSYNPDQIFEDMARQVTDLCGRDRTLIILIHGFNMTLPESRRVYKGARIQIERLYPQRKFVTLELYWDGLYGSPLAIWAEAQVNSKWAGLGLRNFLRRLDPSLPIRVLTHSRGASVICAALWNVDQRGTAPVDARYREAQRALSAPVLPGLRVGMLAPAMRAIDFDTYEERGEGAFSYHDRFVLGINPDDKALLVGGLSGLMGTALGCSPEDFDSVVAPRLNKGRAHAFRVDFSGSVEHGFGDYVLRDVFEDEFLPRLLDGDEDRMLSSLSR